MALLDFMKEGFNSLQSQPQMYDPHANARRLMGGPVQEQQGGGTGFNFFGGNNISQNAQEPLPQMNVTGQVGGPSMTPYQGQEVGPSHLGVTNIDKSVSYNPELPGGGTYNQYYGANEQIWNPETLSYEPAVRGARKDIYSNPEATYSAEQMPTSMQSDGSVAKVDINSLNKQSVPAYSPDSNMVWDEYLQRYVPVTADGGTQQQIPYNKPTDTTGYNINLLGGPTELVGPTQPNGGGATVADNNAAAKADVVRKEREAANAAVDAARDYPEYIDRSGMSMEGDGSEVNLLQQYDTNKIVPKNAGGFTDVPGVIGQSVLDLFSGSEGSAVDNTNYAGGEEVGFNSPDSQLQQQRTTIVEQIMNEDVPDSVKRELFEKYGIDPYEYLQQGLISKK